MGLIPKGGNLLLEEFLKGKSEPMTTRAYWINPATKRLEGFADGRKAMEQVIAKILATARFAFPALSWNYGAELDGLVGQPLPLVESEVKRLTEEALLADERIQRVGNFTVKQQGNSLLVEFEVETEVGNLPFEKVVNGIV